MNVVKTAYSLSISILVLLMSLPTWAQIDKKTDFNKIKPQAVINKSIRNIKASEINRSALIDALKKSPIDFSNLGKAISDNHDGLTKQMIKDSIQKARYQQLMSISHLALTAARPRMGIREYAMQCATALGAAMPNFDCVADGVEIPITQNGISSSGNPQQCDSPALLGGDESCALGARLGHIPTDNPDVDIVFICRKYAHVTANLYQDIAVVHHNKVTGGTCWYQSDTGAGLRIRKEVGSPIYGSDGRPPGRNDLPMDAEYVTWEDPGAISCHSCHQADPFIRTPYVNQVTANGISVLPTATAGPYWHYKLQDWNDSMQQVIVTDQNAAAKDCLTCHRIGSTGTSCKFIEQAGGKSQGQQKEHDLMPNTAWMHADSPGAFVRNIGSRNTNEAVNQLKDCCNGGIPGVCHLKPLPGRADTRIDIVTPVMFAFNRINVLPNTINRLQAKLINADADDQILWQTQNQNGVSQRIGVSASGDTLLWRPRCEPGTQIDIIASGVTSSGSALVNRVAGTDRPVSRTLTTNCISIGNTDLIFEQINQIYAFPMPVTTASLTANSILVSGVGENLIVGDDDQNNGIRSLISFQPDWPAEVQAIEKAKLRFIFGNTLGRPLADPLALKVSLYDYQAPIDTADFIGGRFLPGLVSIDTRAPEDQQSGNDTGVRATSVNVDITQLVQEAFNRRVELNNRIPLVFLLRGLPNNNDRAEQVSILNRVRANSEGLPDTETLLRPVLEIKYQD